VMITSYLEQRGIPRTHILAGLEYDGWTQITVGDKQAMMQPSQNL